MFGFTIYLTGEELEKVQKAFKGKCLIYKDKSSTCKYVFICKVKRWEKIVDKLNKTLGETPKIFDVQLM